MTMRLTKLGALAASALIFSSSAEMAAAQSSKHYATVGIWKVEAVFGGGAFDGCDATQKNVLGAKLRFAQEARSKTWALGANTTANGVFPGVLAFDGVPENIDFDHAGGWAIFPLSASGLALLRKSRNVAVDIGWGSNNFSLRGSSKALAKVTECVNRKGRAPARKPAVAKRAPRSSASAGPKPNLKKSVGARCYDAAIGNYSCRLTQEKPTAGYSEAYQITGGSSVTNYWVKKINDRFGDVWVKFSPQDAQWTFVGRWQTDANDQDCAAPVASQTPEARNNLAQDTWQLCIK